MSERKASRMDIIGQNGNDGLHYEAEKTTAWKSVDREGYPKTDGNYICVFDGLVEWPEVLQYLVEDGHEQWRSRTWEVTSWTEIPQ